MPNGQSIWHCPRCGTVKQDGAVTVPALVDRVREFRADPETCWFWEMSKAQALWHRLGIPEAVAPPGSERDAVR